MKALILTAALATLALTGCGESSAEKAQREAQAAEKAARVAAQKVEDQRKGFHCLSSWDGSHRATVNYIKENLKDPDSYQHIKTSITPVDKEGNHILIMRYRAKNSFGGYVPST